MGGDGPIHADARESGVLLVAGRDKLNEWLQRTVQYPDANLVCEQALAALAIQGEFKPTLATWRSRLRAALMTLLLNPRAPYAPCKHFGGCACVAFFAVDRKERT
jgi:hypothetical protein